MNELWQNMQQKFALLQGREKYLSLFVGVFIIGYLLAWFIIIPSFSQGASLNGQAERKERELTDMNAQSDILRQGLARNYGAKLQKEIKALQNRIDEADSKLHEFGQGFVAADAMPVVLQRILQKQGNIELSGFEVLPGKGISLGNEKQAQVLFYEHRMKLTLRGDYFGLLEYLEHLKAMPDKLFIKVLDYQVTKYPEAELNLELATVSTNEQFFAL